MSGLALRLPHLLLLAVLLSARGARAAPPDSSDAAGDRPVFFDTATVEARPVDSATATVTVLLPAEVEASGARSLADLLREVPALSVLGSGGRAGVTYVSVRGGDPNFTLVLLDGIPLNDWTERQGGAVNLEELPAGLVDRVEVVQGPLTSFYGPSGLAGVVQLFTRGGSGETKVGLRAEAGDASHLRGAAALSGSADALRYSSGVSWEQEQERIADERYRQVDAWGGLDRRFANDIDFRLRGRFVSGETSDYPDASGGPVYGDGLLRSSDHRDLSLGAELDFGPATSRRQQLALSFYGRDLDRESPAVLPVVPASTESTAFSRFRAAWQAPLKDL